jgi:mannose/fructose/N-acetylgalactosamine-specific phosphotransferase system component IIB
MRTVGGCWAQAAEASRVIIANEARSARVIHEEIFGMVIPSKVLVEQRK